MNRPVPVYLLCAMVATLTTASWTEAQSTRAAGPTMCACPGRHKPLGSASTCEEACYGTSSSSSGGSSTNPLVPLTGALVGELFKPRVLTAGEQQAQAEASARAAVARAAAEKEAMARRQARADRLDREAFLRMSLLDAPFNPEKRVTTDSRPAATCDAAAGGQFVCHVVVCGGALNGPSVCCPAGFPKLNECDCQCYAADASFECSRYASCNQSFEARPPPTEPPTPGPEAGK